MDTHGTHEECISGLKAGKAGMGSKGLHASMKKTKSRVSSVDRDVPKKSGKHSCAVSCKNIGNNPIKCTQCKLCVHEGCSSITRWLVAGPHHFYPRCNSKTWPIDGRPMNVVGTKLDVEVTFWHAVTCCAPVGAVAVPLPPDDVWPCESSRNYCLFKHLPPKMCGKVYTTCVRLATAHYSRNLALRILRQSFTVGGWDSIDMYRVSNLSDLQLPSPVPKEGLERHGMNV